MTEKPNFLNLEVIYSFNYTTPEDTTDLRYIFDK